MLPTALRERLQAHLSSREYWTWRDRSAEHLHVLCSERSLPVYSIKRWTAGKKTETRTLKRRTDRIWLPWASGFLAAWRSRIRSNKHCRSAAPPSPVLSVMRAVRGLRRRGGPTCSIECLGISIPMMPARRSGSFAQRRGTGASRGPVAASGCLMRQRIESRPSVVSARRNTGRSTRRGSSGRSVCGLTPRNGSSDRSLRTAGESPCPVSGFATAWRHRGPLGGYSRAVALSNMARGWRSFDRSVQHLSALRLSIARSSPLRSGSPPDRLS